MRSVPASGSDRVTVDCDETKIRLLVATAPGTDSMTALMPAMRFTKFQGFGNDYIVFEADQLTRGQ